MRVKTWIDKLAEAGRKRSSFQDMATEGLITLDELRSKLVMLQEVSKIAQRELEILSRRQERIEEPYAIGVPCSIPTRV